MIPDWVDAESLQSLIVGAILLLAVVAMLLLRLMRKLFVRFVVVVVVSAVSYSLWHQRSGLEDCVDTCSCTLFGQDVAIPEGANPNCD